MIQERLSENTVPTAEVKKRKLQATQTRQRIYNCADKLFREKGYEQTTIAELAEAAGISVGGFYHHFKNKEEIMRIWIMEFDVQYAEYYENVLCSPAMQDVDPVEKIYLMMVTANRIFCSHGYMLSRMAYLLMLREQEVGGHIINPDRPYYRIIRTLVDRAFSAGLLVEEAVFDEVVKNITMISRGCMVEWILQNGDGDLDEMFGKLLRVYLEAIRK